MEVIPPSCTPGVAAALEGWVAALAPAECYQAPWTLSRMKGNSSLLGKVGSGEGNFSFLLFVWCL